MEMKMRLGEGSFEWNGETVTYVEFISGFETAGSQMRLVEVLFKGNQYDVMYNAFTERLRVKVIEKISQITL